MMAHMGGCALPEKVVRAWLRSYLVSAMLVDRRDRQCMVARLRVVFIRVPIIPITRAQPLMRIIRRSAAMVVRAGISGELLCVRALMSLGPLIIGTSSALRTQYVELLRFGWIYDICGDAHGAIAIKRAGQDRGPLSE